MRVRAAAVLVAALAAAPAGAEITAARYAAPTTRYAHGVLGDAVEYGALEFTLANGRTRRITLPEPRVFEDLAPRLADLDDDGAPEVIVVETDPDRGARLAIYDEDGLIAATPHIGTAFRWLAPLGAADLDGDGHAEIAYIDRPHLARILRVWRFRDGALHPVASLAGLTNHRIGEDVISGGLRHCGPRPEIIAASADWSRLIAVTLVEDRLSATDIGPYSVQDATAALACRTP
ncbi:VCBS repeat-containing protein [Actibacterium sp. MT2.3-13A]|uniref:FG-GAP repeat domain-containing protein n=1 Tax=Actibacterium sp. MT2.3-13A TaxID=2828332 RepID=UPI001BA57719|nr:VCBS repeat-containing protein [Actibacterium sp. MT2.3-13A]